MLRLLALGLIVALTLAFLMLSEPELQAPTLATRSEAKLPDRGSLSDPPELKPLDNTGVRTTDRPSAGAMETPQREVVLDESIDIDGASTSNWEIRGQVLRDGFPVEGAWIAPGDGRTIHRSDAEGMFVIPRERLLDEYAVLAVDPSFDTLGVLDITNEDEPYVFDIAPAIIEGRVADKLGRPISGATVSTAIVPRRMNSALLEIVRRAGGSPNTDRILPTNAVPERPAGRRARSDEEQSIDRHTLTDGNGAYSLRAFPIGTTTVEVRHSLFLHTAPLDADVQAHGVHRVDFELSTGTSIRARVLPDHGVVGKQVQVSILIPPARLSDGTLPWSDQTWVGLAGTWFEFGGIPSDQPVTLIAKSVADPLVYFDASSGAPTWVGSVRTRTKDTPTQAEIPIHRAIRVTGRINGATLGSWIRIELRPTEPGCPYSQFKGRLDANRHFTIDGWAPGKYQLTVYGTEGYFQSEEVRINSDQPKFFDVVLRQDRREGG